MMMIFAFFTVEKIETEKRRVKQRIIGLNSRRKDLIYSKWWIVQSLNFRKETEMALLQEPKKKWC